MSPSIDPLEVRQELERRASELTVRDAALTRHLRQEDGRLDADFEDRVSFTAQDEVLEQLDDAARAELTAIRAALTRLEDGTYGLCGRCGDPIDVGRLRALPTTLFCVPCASATGG